MLNNNSVKIIKAESEAGSSVEIARRKASLPLFSPVGTRNPMYSNFRKITGARHKNNKKHAFLP